MQTNIKLHTSSKIASQKSCIHSKIPTTSGGGVISLIKVLWKFYNTILGLPNFWKTGKERRRGEKR